MTNGNNSKISDADHTIFSCTARLQGCELIVDRHMRKYKEKPLWVCRYAQTSKRITNPSVVETMTRPV